MEEFILYISNAIHLMTSLVKTSCLPWEELGRIFKFQSILSTTPELPYHLNAEGNSILLTLSQFWDKTERYANLKCLICAIPKHFPNI